MPDRMGSYVRGALMSGYCDQFVKERVEAIVVQAPVGIVGKQPGVLTSFRTCAQPFPEC